jgi:hypothetical protein
VIKTFRHALALDERRVKFKPVYWSAKHQSPPKKGTMAYHERIYLEDQEREEEKKRKPNVEEVRLQRVWGLRCNTDAFACRCGLLDVILVRLFLSRLLVTYSLISPCSVQMLEGVLVRTVFAFFPSIISTDSREVKNSVKTSLARIPLRWMIRECFRTDTGILFHLDELKTFHLDSNTLVDPITLDPRVLPRPEAPALTTLLPEDRCIQPMKCKERVAGPVTRFFARVKTKLGSIKFLPTRVDDLGTKVSEKHSHLEDVDSEESADLKDSLAPIYDELKLNPLWWVPELFHHGRGRKMNNDKIVNVHRSVKTRKEARYRNGAKYSLKVNINFEEGVKWVD